MTTETMTFPDQGKTMWTPAERSFPACETITLTPDQVFEIMLNMGLEAADAAAFVRLAHCLD